MRKNMKIISLLLLVLFALGCSNESVTPLVSVNPPPGNGGNNNPPPASDPLVPGGEGVAIAQIEGSAIPANFASAVGVNDQNQVIGFVESTAGSSFTAALWTVSSDGTATVSPTSLAPIAGNSFSAAFAVDQQGNIAGQSTKGGRLVAVLWPAGATTPVELPALNASGNSVAFGISDDGTLVAGEAQNAALNTRAVVWVADAGGAFTNPPVVLPVNLVGSSFSSANGVQRVNAEIWVAGEAEDDNGVAHAQLWRSSDGVVFSAADLVNSGGKESTALAVSTGGMIVGEAEGGSNTLAAVLWTANGTGGFDRTDLDADGSALAVNDSGNAVGMAAGKAAVWNTAAPISSAELFTTVSRAYDNNNGDETGFLVVGVNDGKGFIKKVH